VDKNRITIETHNLGHLSVETGLDLISFESLRVLVEEAYAHFQSIPLTNIFVNDLENLVLATASYGSNTIEVGC
jgi:hypothetical protein